LIFENSTTFFKNNICPVSPEFENSTIYFENNTWLFYPPWVNIIELGWIIGLSQHLKTREIKNGKKKIIPPRGGGGGE
jgi:hypothetical protein